MNEVLNNQVLILSKLDQILNPPKPEYVTTKTACALLDKTHAIVLGYIKAAGISPNIVGRTKSYKYSDIEAIATQLGTTLKISH